MKRHKLLIAIGENIRQLRVAKGWSQERLAEEANLDRSYMGAVERGERNIGTLNLALVAKALKVTLKDLFNFPFAF